MKQKKDNFGRATSPENGNPKDSGISISRNDDGASTATRFPKAYRDFSRSVLFLNFIVQFFRRFVRVDIFPFPRKSLLSILHSLPKAKDNMLRNTDHADNGFRMVINELAEYKLLSGYGRVAFAQCLTFTLHGRRDFINYLNAHPEICHVDIGRPIFITGLHRTGTTLLHRLMALDPTCRSTTALDTFPITGFPLVPPFRCEEERINHPRAKYWRDQIIKGWKANAAEEYRMNLRNHRFDPFEAEEEVILYQQCGSSTYQSALLDTVTNSKLPNPPTAATSYTEWFLDEATQSDATLFVKRYIQAFHRAWAPTSHWCLKAPHHALFPTALYDNFPNARYIITHRDPVAAVTSGARLVADCLTAYVESETLDLHGIGENMLHRSALKIERLNRLRQRIREQDPDLEKVQFLDVDFADIVVDPIGTVKKIYLHFEVPFALEHEAAMIDYLVKDEARRKEEREGGGMPLRRPLDIEDFGLTKEIIRNKFPPSEFRHGRAEAFRKE